MKSRTSERMRNDKKINPNPKESTRNWLDLPKDIMIHIFLKVGVIDVLHNAQSVCSFWRKLAKEPQLFRCIDMRNPWKHFDEFNFEAVTRMALEAINRSFGELVEFSIDYFGTDEVLKRIVESSHSLRCLRLHSCYEVSDDALIETVKKLPLLEELELCLCSFYKVIETIGSSCPQLNYFRLNQNGVMYSPEDDFEEFNDEAFAIAAHMPHVRRLHLFGNSMNENGLKAILHTCLHLEYLDLRQCYSINFDEDLMKKCKEIETLRMPNDSTDDYEFDATVHCGGAFEDEYEDAGFENEEYVDGFSDLDVYDNVESFDLFDDDYDDTTSGFFGF